ncbi:MAG: IS1182 family transposase [Lysobacterales bacterium]|jgi:transposase
MGTRFRPYQPDQPYLLPPSPADWLPDGHLAYFISEVVDQLDVSAFCTRYEGDGRRNSPYHPTMMLKVLLYAYSSGVFSSRKIAGKLVVDIAFRVLSAGNFPDFRTINRFRQQHLREFQDVFVQVVSMAREMKLLKLGTLAVDGSKVRANASKHKAMSYGRMKQEQERLRGEIAELLERAQAVDEAEDLEYGADKQGDELPEELERREQRLQKIQEAKRRLEQRQREADRAAGRSEDDGNNASGVRPQGGRSKFRRQFGEVPDKQQDNFTDPESRIMKTGDGFQQCYNAQAAVDGDTQLIVASAVEQNAADNGSLIPMTRAARANAGRQPARVLADAGYASEENFQRLNEDKITGYVALGREGKAGRKINPEHLETQAMKQRLGSKPGKAWYKRRKAIVEPVFGWVKEALGFRRFRLRGLAKVSAEWDLVCTAVNLRRIHVLSAAAAAR